MKPYKAAARSPPPLISIGMMYRSRFVSSPVFGGLFGSVVTGSVPEVTGVDPEVTGVDPEVTGVDPEVTGVDPEVTGVEPEVTGVEPEVTGSDPEVTGTVVVSEGGSVSLPDAFFARFMTIVIESG